MRFIFGACKNGLLLKKIFERCTNEKIDYFVDNNPQKQGQSLAGVNIISYQNMREMCKISAEDNRFFIALLNPEGVIDLIRDNAVNADIYTLTRKYFASDNKDSITVDDALCAVDCSLQRLNNLEVHVTHHCNLKCKGCGHMSNIVSPEFASLGQFQKDLRQLKKYFWGVKRFRLLGGEPLLNLELPEYVKETRKVFPDANIRIATNGLLIPSVKHELYEVMRRECAGFDISCYHPTAKIKEKIELICIENGIEYAISNEIDYFFKRYPETERKDPYLAYNTCESKNCHFMLDGKISLCPGPILRKKFKEYSNRRYFEEDIIDLYDENLTPDRLFYLMSHPNKQCSYCSSEKEMFEWEGYYNQ